MSSFSDKLKAATTATYNTRLAKLASEPAVMTLEEPAYNGLAYSPEPASEEWILSDKYLYYEEYEDTNYSVIDDEKNISINEKQVNITQEVNSQFIPFQMARRYDGYDLMNATILVHFVNADGFEERANVVNVYYNNDQIRFGWLVGKNATAVAGDLQIEIEALGVNSKGDEYNWKTKSNKSLKVLQSLCGNGIIEPDDSWITSFLTQVTEQVGAAQKASTEAKQAAKEAKEVAVNVEDTITNAEATIEGNVLNAIRGEIATTLDGYYTEEETNTLVSNTETSILSTLRGEVSNALLNYYTIEQVDKMFEDFDISDQLVDIEKSISDLSDKHTNEVSNINAKHTEDVKGLNTRIDNIDGLAKFDVEYVDETRTLTFYNGDTEIKAIVLNSNPTAEWVSAYDTKVDTKISEALSPINEDLQGIHENIDNLPETLKTDYYTKDETFSKKETLQEIANAEPDLTGIATELFVNEKFGQLNTDIGTNTKDIQSINTAITTINQELASIDKSPNARYVTTYNEAYEVDGVQYTGENTLVVYEVYNKDTEDETRTVVSSHVITGGSGGSATTNIIKIDRVTPSPFVVTEDDDLVIEYILTATDSSGESIGQCNASWKLGTRVIKTEKVYPGENFINLTEFISTGSDQKVTLTISDDIGTIQQKTWYVSVVDVKLETTFDDTRYYTAGSPATFTYTPKGAVDKTVHFLLDGEEVDTATSSKAAAGLSASYTVPAHEHGTHLLEAYMTAEINDNTIESNHIVKDIIWYDVESVVPVIGTVYQDFTARQYETTNIKYTVYDPSTETPSVTLRATYVNEDGETVETYNSSLVLSSNTDVWAFKTDVIGEHTLTITCGETVKTLKATITELGIEVSPTTAGLEFDFNPVGYSNNDANRIWSDKNTGVSMTVSDNFDWVNGGYQMDEAGDQYFCIKAGTTATINYNLFADDAKANGKEFKVIFKTTNVKSRNTSFISCMDYGIGLDMKVESANIYSSNGNLYSPYCEDDVIEFEFNINKNTDIPMVVTYEDGVGNRPMIYTSDSSFWQTNPAPISIGSQNCDVHIYRMKAYSTSLTDSDILNNFIADARSAEEMIARYTRNQIYKEGVLDPEYLAEVCPDLRIILVDAPWFTNDKDNKIDDTNITMIYKNGDPVLDNWTCTGARHSGQGTSSNEYGYSSRNIDLIMDTDTSLFTLGDGVTTANTITLTRNSVPTDYLNVKVNVASNENENNAQNARNYSLFNPFIRFARWKDSNVKDCMEFFNCVIFIRERDEDISTHREFQDTNYHFYSIGNVGDSKKTDDTRVNNKKDPKEHTIEIKDYNVPLAEFPTGTEGICSESEWKAGNTAYDNLYAEYKYKDGKFKSFGNDSYEFRYEMKGITEEQRQANIDVWRDMYKFIVTSSDEDFYAKLKEWFVVDSALYYYLFTERYLMCDNRAKNSFWHYGKVYISTEEAVALGEDANGYIIDNEQASIREGYRYDLTQGYDFD